MGKNKDCREAIDKLGKQFPSDEQVCCLYAALAYRQKNFYPVSASHVTRLHPEWSLTCPDGYKILNPGLPEVQTFVTSVISDVVRRYDVDGIHMDDYFYPYPEHSFTTEDSATFRQYPHGFSTDQLSDWRRDNVNRLLRQIRDYPLDARRSQPARNMGPETRGAG